jgi:hypothetical protein
VTATTYTPAGDLAPTDIYWQVRAFDAVGNASAWSTMFVVKLTSPVAGSPALWRTTDTTPTLTWTAIPWADSYHIQVSSNATFTAIVWEDSAVAVSELPSATVGITLSNGRYYWRVRAKAPALSNGVYGPFSSGSTFYVNPS